MSVATLVSQLSDLLQKERHHELSSFLKEILEGKFSESDKKTFADFVIAWIEDQVIPKNEESLFHELIVFLYSFAPQRAYEIACLYYTYGRISGKGRYYLYAQDKISEVNPLTGEGYRLWGNILIELGHYISEDLFFEQAVDKYAEAYRLMGPSVQLLWDWAQGWKELSDRSGEISDLKQAIAHFQKALSLKPVKAQFFVNFGQALSAYAHLTGNPYYIKEAIEMYKVSLMKQETPSGYLGYVLAHVKLYELTHARSDFERASKVIEETIAAVPSEADLWMHWGELYLKSGWQNQSLRDLEVAVEKLTSMKIQECSPICITALLSHALVTLGLLTEDIKLLHEGKERVMAVVNMVPDHKKLYHAAGATYLAHGMYFQDENAFKQAVHFFKKGIAKDGTQVEDWFGLYQAYYNWALAKDEADLMQKGLKAIQRLTLLRPYSPFYLTHFGITLLSLSKMEAHPEPYIEEALVKFRKALSLREETETLYHYAYALNLLGDLTADVENYEEAISILKTLYHKLPTDMRIVQELGISLARYGELTSAIECIEEAIHLFEVVVDRQKEDDGVLCLLGYAKLLLSELVEDPSLPERGKKLKSDAETILLNAAHLGNGEASYHLACLYSLTKHLDLAMEHLVRSEVAGGLPLIEDVEHDAWLHNLSECEAFQEFLNIRKRE